MIWHKIPLRMVNKKQLLSLKWRSLQTPVPMGQRTTRLVPRWNTDTHNEHIRKPKHLIRKEISNKRTKKEDDTIGSCRPRFIHYYSLVNHSAERSRISNIWSASTRTWIRSSGLLLLLPKRHIVSTWHESTKLLIHTRACSWELVHRNLPVRTFGSGNISTF